MRSRDVPRRRGRATTLSSMLRSRPLPLIALVAVIVALALPSGVSAQPSADRATQSEPARPAERSRDLSDDVVRPEARPGVLARIRSWPGNRIPYYESIPRKWQWSLDRAVDQWNRAGGNIRLVKVPRARAKLMIRYGPTYGADGIGTLGYQARNFIHLSPAYKRVDAGNPEQRTWVGILFAHEIGHVLGFDHFGPQCTLMHPIFYFGTCPLLVDDKPGWYHCRWIDKRLLTRFIGMYGGSAERPPKHCLLEALPPQLRDVRFAGGGPEPVRLTWDVGRVRAGTKVEVRVRPPGDCSDLDRPYERFRVDPGQERWTDPGHGSGTWCYRVHIENRFGAARPDFADALPRHAPVPETPVVAPAVWRPTAQVWRFAWDAPAGTRLVALFDPDDPTACPTAYDPDLAYDLYESAAGSWDLWPSAPDMCVRLVAVTEWDTVSPPGPEQRLQAARPAAPVVSEGVWDEEAWSWVFDVDLPDADSTLVVMRDYEDPAACATTYDEWLAEWPWDEGGGVYRLWSSGQPECLVFFTLAPSGAVSDPVVRQKVPPGA